MNSIRVVVNDKMQRKYVYYRTEPVGKNFHPEFKPQLTPKQMLELGVFGGRYMSDCAKEFPDDWYDNAKLCAERHDPKLNHFGVNASQPLSVWREKGWIYRDDPRGWFQWYCRYYMGRRCEDDERQIVQQQLAHSRTRLRGRPFAFEPVARTARRRRSEPTHRARIGPDSSPGQDRGTP